MPGRNNINQLNSNKGRLSIKAVLKGTAFLLCIAISLGVISITSSQFTYCEALDTAHGIFNDTPIDAYYYDSICDLYFNGLIAGYSSTTFGPNDNISKTQLLTILDRILRFTDDSTYNSEQTDQPWDYTISEWAVANGIETADTIQANVTRFDMARYLVELFDIPTSDVEGSVFVDTSDIYANELYQLGVTAGVPSEVGLLYNGDSPITRAQACVMIDRLLEKPIASKYVDELTDSRYTRQELTPMPDTLETEDDFAQVWRHMIDHSLNKYTLSLDGMVFQTYDEMMDFAIMAKRSINDMLDCSPEYQGYIKSYSVSVAYTLGIDFTYGNVSLTFILENHNDLTAYGLSTRIETSREEMIGQIIQMYNTGILDNTMTVKEKAWEVVKFTVENIDYDYSYTYRTAYDALDKDIAVCQGYASVCGYMLQLLGIDAVTENGETATGSHEWIKVSTEDGTFYIDPTWVDTGISGVYDTKWFWATKESLENDANWRIFPE